MQDMIKDCGATWAIIGHSERREYFGETNEACLFIVFNCDFRTAHVMSLSQCRLLVLKLPSALRTG